MFSCVLMLMLSLFAPSSLENLQDNAVILSLFIFALFILSSLMKRDLTISKCFIHVNAIQLIQRQCLLCQVGNVRIRKLPKVLLYHDDSIRHRLHAVAHTGSVNINKNKRLCDVPYTYSIFILLTGAFTALNISSSTQSVYLPCCMSWFFSSTRQ